MKARAKSNVTWDSRSRALAVRKDKVERNRNPTPFILFVRSFRKQYWKIRGKKPTRSHLGTAKSAAAFHWRQKCGARCSLYLTKPLMQMLLMHKCRSQLKEKFLKPAPKFTKSRFLIQEATMFSSASFRWTKMSPREKAPFFAKSMKILESTAEDEDPDFVPGNPGFVPEDPIIGSLVADGADLLGFPEKAYKEDSILHCFSILELKSIIYNFSPSSVYISGLEKLSSAKIVWEEITSVGFGSGWKFLTAKTVQELGNLNLKIDELRQMLRKVSKTRHKEQLKILKCSRSISKDAKELKRSSVQSTIASRICKLIEKCEPRELAKRSEELLKMIESELAKPVWFKPYQMQAPNHSLVTTCNS